MPPPRVSYPHRMPRITRTSWFGPKRLGWGWSPASWQGWAVTAGFVVVVGVAMRITHRSAAGIAAAVAALAVFLLICFLTGDPPGSRLTRR
jgi:hypothetical protein